jgi:hypothetical protein
MTFPNAHDGVKKIYKSQILELIGSALAIPVGILSIFAAAETMKENVELASGLAVALLLCGIAAAVVCVIALVLYIIGIIRAKADEPMFGRALICVIVSLVCSVLLAIFTQKAMLKHIMELVQSLAELCAMIFIIGGIQLLAKKLERPDIDVLCRRMLYILIAVQLSALVVNILTVIFARNPVMLIVSARIALVPLVLSIVSVIVYLVLLKRTVKMLED